MQPINNIPIQIQRFFVANECKTTENPFVDMSTIGKAVMTAKQICFITCLSVSQMQVTTTMTI